MFKKILIANRGEIALRVMRTCQEMGIATVAVFSDADENALHTPKRRRGRSCIGPAEPTLSYLNHGKNHRRRKGDRRPRRSIPDMDFCLKTHTVRRTLCKEAGLVFIGPAGTRSSEDLGDKMTGPGDHDACQGACAFRGSSGEHADRKEMALGTPRAGRDGPRRPWPSAYPVLIKAGGRRGAERGCGWCTPPPKMDQEHCESASPGKQRPTPSDDGAGFIMEKFLARGPPRGDSRSLPTVSGQTPSICWNANVPFSAGTKRSSKRRQVPGPEPRTACGGWARPPLQCCPGIRICQRRHR